jgi:hypothetical protein
MTERGTIVRKPYQPLSEKRRKRIERELKALRAMERALGTRDMIWAVLTIPAVAALCLIIAAKVQWFGGSVAASILGAVATGALVWWIGRRWLTIAVLIVFALVMIAFEGDGLDFDLPGGDRKSARRAKLERAIARREALLKPRYGR